MQAVCVLFTGSSALPDFLHGHFVRGDLKQRQEFNPDPSNSLSDVRLKVINNFGRKFGKILAYANVRELKFHDFRNTALNKWFTQGLKEYEVMRLAGHSSFSTTHKLHLAVADDSVDHAREATAKILRQHLASTPFSG